MDTLYKPEANIIPRSDVGTARRNEHQLIQDAIYDLIVDTVFRFHRAREDGNSIPPEVQEDWAELCSSVDPFVAELAAFDQDREARQLVKAQVGLKWQAILTRRGYANSCALYNSNLSSGLDQ